ncbi:hypothetical protein F5Y16DRAFT_403412 [Xylariaceae sp. FL0255]|nr:hypothetical protein F5Y16DRAFT_403412 [Xylariaceae sp. FL0255]
MSQCPFCASGGFYPNGRPCGHQNTVYVPDPIFPQYGYYPVQGPPPAPLLVEHIAPGRYHVQAPISRVPVHAAPAPEAIPYDASSFGLPVMPQPPVMQPAHYSYGYRSRSARHGQSDGMDTGVHRAGARTDRVSGVIAKAAALTDAAEKVKGALDDLTVAMNKSETPKRAQSKWRIVSPSGMTSPAPTPSTSRSMARALPSASGTGVRRQMTDSTATVFDSPKTMTPSKKGSPSLPASQAPESHTNDRELSPLLMPMEEWLEQQARKKAAKEETDNQSSGKAKKGVIWVHYETA